VKKVLIIDDEVDLCLLLGSYLSKKECEVYFSHKLDEGIRKCREICPEVLFLDNNLPDGNGWDKAGYFLSQFSDMHIYLVSAFRGENDYQVQNDRLTILEKPLSLKVIETEFGKMI
jgi:DNA-binding response OmpR family regulator